MAKFSGLNHTIHVEEPKYRALTDLFLRQSPDPKSPLYERWHEWKAGDVFEPPAHMRIDRCLERGIIEAVMYG